MGFFFWFLCIFLFVALVLLLFPFYFKIDFEIGERGCWAHFFFFKKKFYSVEKKWGKSKSEGESETDKEDLDDDACMPSYVDTAPVKPSAPVVASQPAKEPVTVSVEASAPGSQTEKEDKASSLEKRDVEDVVAAESKPDSAKEKNEIAKADAPKVETLKSENKIAPVVTSTPVSPASDTAAETATVKEKPEKRKLTERELWTILLTPDLDEKAFNYVKKLLGVILRLLRVKFVDCFVEGIRMEYDHMGYGTALNGVLKSFPYIGAWDFRMDWCRNAELRAAGTIRASVNLNRVLGLVLVALYYSGILGTCFWFRRKKVLKTGELPELGFVRKKILDLILEE